MSSSASGSVSNVGTAKERETLGSRSMIPWGLTGTEYNYVVTAMKSSVVNFSCIGNFTSPSTRNLILALATRIEIHTLSSEGIQPVLDAPVYGRISCMELFRPPSEVQDLLFIVTEREKMCILALDSNSHELITRANGDLTDPSGRKCEAGAIAHVDPSCSLIAVHLYNGLLKIIPLHHGGGVKEAFNVRVDELRVVDFCFLQGESVSTPTITVLYEDVKERRHVKTYEISLADKELQEVVSSERESDAGVSRSLTTTTITDSGAAVKGSTWIRAPVEQSATMVIPVPFGGILCIGDSVISYHNGSLVKSTYHIKVTCITACCPIDEDRYLLGDYCGRLFILVFVRKDGEVSKLSVEYLGKVNIASCLAYLDNRVIFVGSRSGNSQIVRIGARKTEEACEDESDELEGHFGVELEVLDEMVNIGPIVDFAVVDFERMGQGQVITCSGIQENGSLRIVRNGIGINEIARADIEGIKGLWSLCGSDSTSDQYLVLSFVTETRLLEFREGVLDEVSFPGIVGEASSLLFGDFAYDCWIQVLNSEVRLIARSSGELVNTWKPPVGKRVTCADLTLNECVVAIGTEIVVLHIERKKRKGFTLIERDCLDVSAQVSCISLGPIEKNGCSAFCALSCWEDFSLRIVRLVGGVEEVCCKGVGVEVVPRSVLFAHMEGVLYLFCGLGDGRLLSFVFDWNEKSLKDMKSIGLGTQPLSLTLFSSGGASHVFACSDRPSIVHSKNKKLVYSNVNVKEVAYMCPFQSSGDPGALVLATLSSMILGTVDEIQKLHIRHVPMGEMVRRIIHVESADCFVVITDNLVAEGVGSLKLLDQMSFKVRSAFELQEYEMGCCLWVTDFQKLVTDEPDQIERPSETFVICGTGISKSSDSEGGKDTDHTKGRILVFRIAEEAGVVHISMVAEMEVLGAVFSMTSYQNHLICSVNNRIEVFRWTETTEGFELVHEVSVAGPIFVVSLRSWGDFIVVADLMKSISLYQFNAADSSLREVACDLNPNWMSATAVLEPDVFLGAENNYNLFVVKRRTDAKSEEKACRLDTVGRFHLGDFVNVIRRGSLVMRPPDDSVVCDTQIFGTTSGMIGVVASLRKEDFSFFSAVEAEMRKTVHGVGGFDHAEWRSFALERGPCVPCTGFVDGDLVECFLDLPLELQEKVVKGLVGSPSVEYVWRRIEEMARVH